MRLFKIKDKLNWKYVLGEILLIFIGINLAIWFNNWNSSKKTSHDKKIAITKIVEEIENNAQELEVAQKNYQFILDAFSDYKKLYSGNTSALISTPKELEVFKKKYPAFFKVKDSIAHKNGSFRYDGSTHIEMEIPTLTEIAWETTRTISITNEFDYECLYNLESMYNLQRRVHNEVNKASNALQKREFNELVSILKFLNQLGFQLQENYKSTLTNIKDCS